MQSPFLQEVWSFVVCRINALDRYAVDLVCTPFIVKILEILVYLGFVAIVFKHNISQERLRPDVVYSFEPCYLFPKQINSELMFLCDLEDGARLCNLVGTDLNVDLRRISSRSSGALQKKNLGNLMHVVGYAVQTSYHRDGAMSHCVLEMDKENQEDRTEEPNFHVEKYGVAPEGGRKLSALRFRLSVGDGWKRSRRSETLATVANPREAALHCGPLFRSNNRAMERATLRNVMLTPR